MRLPTPGERHACRRFRPSSRRTRRAGRVVAGSPNPSLCASQSYRRIYTQSPKCCHVILAVHRVTIAVLRVCCAAERCFGDSSSRLRWISEPPGDRVVTAETNKTRAIHTRTQRRGDERRHGLLRAAKTLLGRKDVPDVTFAAVCADAGVPVGSARYFYPDINALLQALMVESGKHHDAMLMRPLRPSNLASWRSLVACMIDRSARFHRANPVHAKLTISGKTLPELKRLDREADRVRSQQIVALLDEHFVVPRIPELADVAYLVAEIVDTSFALSMAESGRITPKWLNYAKISATELLAYYFGRELDRRPAAPPGGTRGAKAR